MTALERRINKSTNQKIASEKYALNNSDKIRETSRLFMRKKRKSIREWQENCICCNEPILNGLYCDSCRDIKSKVTAKASREKINNHQFENVVDSINVSDSIFTTDLCDMDCENCKHNDCILPEE